MVNDYNEEEFDTFSLEEIYNDVSTGVIKKTNSELEAKDFLKAAKEYTDNCYGDNFNFINDNLYKFYIATGAEMSFYITTGFIGLTENAVTEKLKIKENQAEYFYEDKNSGDKIDFKYRFNTSDDYMDIQTSNNYSLENIKFKSKIGGNGHNSIEKTYSLAEIYSDFSENIYSKGDKNLQCTNFEQAVWNKYHEIDDYIGFWFLDCSFYFDTTSEHIELNFYEGFINLTDDVGQLPEDPVKNGYKFVGWYYDNELTRPYNNEPITSDTQFFAKFDLINYSINYVLYGGVLSSPVDSYNIETNSITLAIPSREGYNFKGWYTDSNCTQNIASIEKGSTGDVQVFAKWEKKTYKVTFYVDDNLYLESYITHGTVLEDLKLINQASGDDVVLFTSKALMTEYDLTSPVSQDMTLYADKSFTIYVSLTYSFNDETLTDLLVYNSSLENLRTPVKEGYTFEGWYFDADLKNLVTSTSKIIETTTIYASFKKIDDSKPTDPTDPVDPVDPTEPTDPTIKKGFFDSKKNIAIIASVGASVLAICIFLIVKKIKESK